MKRNLENTGIRFTPIDLSKTSITGWSHEVWFHLALGVAVRQFRLSVIVLGRWVCSSYTNKSSKSKATQIFFFIFEKKKKNPFITFGTNSSFGILAWTKVIKNLIYTSMGYSKPQFPWQRLIVGRTKIWASGLCVVRTRIICPWTFLGYFGVIQCTFLKIGP